MDGMERRRIMAAAGIMTIAASATVLTTSPAGAVLREKTCTLVGGDYWENGELATSPAEPSVPFPDGWAEGHGGCPLSQGGWTLCYSCTYICHEPNELMFPYEDGIWWGERTTCHYLDDEQYENQLENCEYQYPGGWAFRCPSEPQ
jgi:hypothetical protein